MNISVITPVYNAERFIEKAVNSALQFEEVKEILLIEDCSTDNSLEICKKLELQHERVKLFQHPDQGNHGAGATRNLGLKKASQEFIAFLDADDYYLPNRFDAEREIFKNPDIEGVFGAIGVEYFSEKGKKEFEEKFKNIALTTVNFHAENDDVFFGLINLKKGFGSFFTLNALTVKKSALIRENLQFNEKLRVHQDSDFIIKLAYHCYLKSGMIDRAVAIRGVHDDNRITKIKRYSSDFYKRQFLLYQSLFLWSKQQEKFPKEAKNHLRLIYFSFKIANKKGIKKYFEFVKTIFLFPKFLKTRYRFHALKKHI